MGDNMIHKIKIIDRFILTGIGIVYSIIKSKEIILRLGNTMFDEVGNRFVISMLMPSSLKLCSENEDTVIIGLHSVSGKDLIGNYLTYDVNSLFYYDAILSTYLIPEDLHKEIEYLQKLSDELSDWPVT